MKKTTSEFIEEATAVWGDRWDYSRTEYDGANTKVEIGCKDHGIFFLQIPRSHTYGKVGCQLCSGKKVTTDMFVARATEKFGGRWDYSKTVYSKYDSPITVRCKKHDIEFVQSAGEHLRGAVGCKECASQRKTTEQFISESKAIWGDRWDYSKTNYIDAETKVTIICREHGEFEQLPTSHSIRGYVGCHRCSGWALSEEEFISRVKRIYGDSVGTDKVVYKSLDSFVILTCKEHGDYERLASYALSGKNGCPTCKFQPLSREKFLSRCRSTWGDRWDYSKTKFHGVTGYITVTCREHGDFTQLVGTHMNGGVGCRQCAPYRTSCGELEVQEFLSSIGVRTEKSNVYHEGRRYEIDLLDREKNIGVEFNGVFWHSDKFLDQNYHYRKYLAAKENGIRLLQIWEDDWRDNQEVVKSHLSHVFGSNQEGKVYARNLEINEVSVRVAQDFLRKHHIQGYAGSSVRVGGFHQGELVALAALKKDGGDYTLVRYATSKTVVGGHSKLISYFEKNYDYGKLITFADLTFSDGGLYEKTGWTEDSFLLSDYSYLVGRCRKHKFGYRMERFQNDQSLQYVGGMTERELADLNGLLRVYDAGKIRFVKEHPRKNQSEIEKDSSSAGSMETSKLFRGTM